jgi:hypothetical protein
MRTLHIEPSKNSWDNEMDYSKYGFEVLSIYDEKKNLTDFKAIRNVKTERIIAMPRIGYKLLPNEVVLEASNQVADTINLEQFKLITDSVEDWKTFKPKSKYYKSKKTGHKIVQYINGNEHALIDEEATRMFAFYKIPKLHLIDKNEDINFGICVRNSVDGSCGLAIDGFTFRHICGNASLMTLTQIMKAGQQVSARHRHTKNLNIGLDNIEEWILNVSEKMGRVKALYETWMVEQLNKDTVFKLGRSMPVKYLPDYINVEKKKVTLTADPTPTMWQTYNDLTAKIWHEQVELKTKQLLFETIHWAYGMGK